MTVYRLNLKYGQVNPKTIEITMFFSFDQVVK